MKLNEFIQTQYTKAMEKEPVTNEHDYLRTKRLADKVLTDLAGAEKVAEKKHYQNLLNELNFYDERRAFEIGFKTALRHLNMLQKLGE